MPHAETNGQKSLDRPAEANNSTEAVPEEDGRVASGSAHPETPTASGLTHRLSAVARPDPVNQAELLCPSETESARQLAYFCEARHDAGEGNDEPLAQEQGIVSKWRQKERLKTTAVALVLCLNIGVDPPDVIKISPCARLECWVDPMSMQPPKALETIGKNLQAQYERWQPRAKYRMHLDPTTDEVKKLAISCRRSAKNERVLFHYNGHGVPRPTANGEIWVFNKSYTQYIPLSMYDLQAWVGSPCIYVFDCSAAGIIVNSFRQFAEQRAQEMEAMRGTPNYPLGAGLAIPEEPMKECILLAACGANEMLPQNPDLPADVFTACLTTPIKVALRWFCSKSLLCSEGLTKDLIDQIPGKQTDRKTPLGELNWIFTAITDTIAWNTLPRALFQKLFRQDLLVASLFRNFLLAERIMRAANCTPVSYPRLPPTHQHPMWQAWDMAAEMCLLQLPPIVNSEADLEFQPSPFFSEQLTAFELWLEHGSKDKKPPEQLPIVLQVLLSQVHRLRALRLLGSFLDMGPWAVDLALSVGIFPYVLKLLQTTATDLRETLVFIWTKILALDKSCQDLVKDNGQLYFINYLNLQEERPNSASAQAAFVLAVICDGQPRGQLLCAQAGLLGTLLRLLAAPGNTPLQGQRDFHTPDAGLLVKWLCLCLGKLSQDTPEVTALALQQGAADLLARLLVVSNPEVRGAAVFALGTLIQGGDGPGDALLVDAEGRGAFPEVQRLALDRALACHLLQVVYDASPLVRAEVALALGRMINGHSVLFQDAVGAQQRRTARVMKQRAAPAGSSPTAPHSAPTDTAARRHFEQANPVDDTGSKSMHQVRVPNGRNVNSSDTANSSSPVNSAPMAASPGVYAAQTSGRYSSMPPESSFESPTGSPGSLHGNFASADAARVGGGLYTHLLEALCTLATDPAPSVAKMGNAVLRMAGVQLTPLMSNSGPGLSRSTGQLACMDTAGSGSLGGMAPSASVSNLSQTGLPPSSKWHPRSLWRQSGKPLHAPSSVSTSPSSPSTPVLEMTNRMPFVLRQVHADGTLLQRAQSLQSAGSSEPGDLGGRPGTAGSSADDLQAPSSSGKQPVLQPLESPTYAIACRFFSEPLNDKEMREWVAMGHSPGYGSPHRSVKAQWQPWRVESRQHDQDTSVHTLKSFGTAAELNFRPDQVENINTESPGNAALLLHPFRPLVIAVDAKGVVRVYSTRKPYTLKNAFYISLGEGLDMSQKRRGPNPAPTSVVSIWQINQIFNGLLLSGAADGGVRVWRDYTFPRTQRLATAWQAVPIAQPSSSPGPGHKAVYDWQECSGSLFAAGGVQPSVAHKWDLQQELCTQQIHAGLDNNGVAQPLHFLAASRLQDNLLLAATSTTVRLFDLRASAKAAATLRPHDQQPLMGMVLEPGGVSNQLVTATAAGELKFVDFRMNESAGRLGVYKSLDAHPKGSLSAIVCHPHAALIATGTTSQVVKLWGAGGEKRGVVRTQTSLLNSQRIGPISCLTFHPHRPLLASGSTDSLVTLYPIEHSHPSQEGAVKVGAPSISSHVS